MHCEDCKYYRYMKDRYYDECRKLPMAILPDDEPCHFFKRRKANRKGGERWKSELRRFRSTLV